MRLGSCQQSWMNGYKCCCHCLAQVGCYKLYVCGVPDSIGQNDMYRHFLGIESDHEGKHAVEAYLHGG